eukprot:3936648-Rhodomonas_salina.2
MPSALQEPGPQTHSRSTKLTPARRACRRHNADGHNGCPLHTAPAPSMRMSHPHQHTAARAPRASPRRTPEDRTLRRSRPCACTRTRPRHSRRCKRTRSSLLRRCSGSWRSCCGEWSTRTRLLLQTPDPPTRRYRTQLTPELRPCRIRTDRWLRTALGPSTHTSHPPSRNVANPCSRRTCRRHDGSGRPRLHTSRDARRCWASRSRHSARSPNTEPRSQLLERWHCPRNTALPWSCHRPRRPRL